MFVRDLNEMREYEAQERYEMDMATLLKAGEARCEARGIEKGALKWSLETAKACLTPANRWSALSCTPGSAMIR